MSHILYIYEWKRRNILFIWQLYARKKDEPAKKQESVQILLQPPPPHLQQHKHAKTVFMSSM